MQITDLQKKAEELMLKKQSTSNADLSRADMLKLFQELEVQRIEMELVYEELLKAKSDTIEKDYESLAIISANDFNTLNLAAITTTEEGIITGFNNVAEKLLGYDADQLTGKTSLISLFKAGVMEEESVIFAKNSDNQINPGFEAVRILAGRMPGKPHRWTFVKKDGTDAELLLSLNSLKDPDGKISGYLALAFDNTISRKTVEDADNSDHPFNRMFIEHSAIMLIVHPETGEIASANNSAKKYYGYNFDQSDRMNIKELSLMDLKDIREEMKAESDQNRNKLYFKHNTRYGVRPVEVNLAPVEYQGEKMLLYIISDITEKAKAEELLQWNE